MKNNFFLLWNIMILFPDWDVGFSPARRLEFKLDYFLVKTLDATGGTATLAMPLAGDSLISEVLPNPKSGWVDFLMIYNYSGKICDASCVSIPSENNN